MAQPFERHPYDARNARLVPASRRGEVHLSKLTKVSCIVVKSAHPSGGEMARERSVYVGPRLRRLRRDLGLKQSDMAEDLGISPSYIALLERNQRPVTADLLLRMA